MATSQRAFDQVKNILGKLDRNIDSVREQRTGHGLRSGPASPASPVPSSASYDTTIGQANVNGHGFGSLFAPKTQPSPSVPVPLNLPSNGTPSLRPEQSPAANPGGAANKWGRAQPVRGDQKVG